MQFLPRNNMSELFFSKLKQNNMILNICRNVFINNIPNLIRFFYNRSKVNSKKHILRRSFDIIFQFIWLSPASQLPPLEIKNIQSHIDVVVLVYLATKNKRKNPSQGINFNSNPSKSLMFSFFFCVFFVINEERWSSNKVSKS